MHVPRRSISTLSILLALLALLVVPSTPAAADTRPLTVPALREWTAGGAAFTFTEDTEIVVDPADQAALSGDASTFAEDLAALTGHRPPVVGSADLNDIVLTLDQTDSQLGTQGYRLTVNGVLTVAAASAHGLFNGTRTVLQLLHQRLTVPGGMARDWPSYAERGFLLDTVPRKYSRDYWHNLIRELSYLKLNELTLSPILGGEALSDEEIADITAYAEKYHVNATPVLAMPTHADPLLIERPEFRLDTRDPAALVYNSFDFTKPGALEVARNYIERYIDRFPSRYWLTGGDEYLKYPYWTSPTFDTYPQFKQFAVAKTGNPNAQSRDAFLWFLNWVNALVKSHGKTLRVWNDTLENGGTLTLDRDIVVDYWIRSKPDGPPPTPQQLADPAGPFGGHKVMNSTVDYTYYESGQKLLDPRALYDTFEVTTFKALNDTDHVTGAAVANVLGARLQAWMFSAPGKPDDSSEELAANVERPFRALAQKTWGSAKLAPTYDGFIPIMAAVGKAPGNVRTSRFDAVGAPVLVQGGDGVLHSFVRFGDGRLSWARQTAAGSRTWSAPVVLAQDVAARPAVALEGGRLTYVARSTSGQLVAGRQDDTGWWTTPRVLATGTVGDPTLVAGGGGLTYAIRSASGSVLVGSGPDWSAPTAVASAVVDDPVLASNADGRAALFLRQASGTLLYAAAPFGSSVELSRGLAAAPVVAADTAGRLTYFARTTAGGLEHGWQTTADGTWYPQPALLAQGVAGQPAVALDAERKLTVFVRTADGRLLHRWQATPGGGWSPTVAFLYGDLGGDPVVATERDGRLGFFVRRNDGLLAHRWQSAPAGAWAADVALLATSLAPGAAPAVVRDATGRLTYLATATFGYVYFGFQQEPAGAFNRTLLVGTIES